MNRTYRNIWNPATGTWCAAAENTKRRGKSAQLAGSVVMVLGALGSVDALAAAEPAVAGVGGLELCRDSSNGIAYGMAGVGTGGRPPPIDCAPGGGKVSFSLNNAANNAGGYGLSVSTARITGYSTGVLELRGTGGISMLNDVLMNGNGITQLKAGQVSADSTDAITGSQLFAVSSAVDKNAADIAANQRNIGDLAAGKLGLVQQAGAGQKITVGAGTDGKSVDFTNKAGATRTLTGVTAGVLSASSTDAVNGKQLFTTNQNVSTNTANISNLSQTTENLVAGRAGLVQQLGSGQKITVGAATDGVLVDLSNNGGGARTLTGVAVGELSVGSTDAVNGSQLFVTNRNVANNTAGIEKNSQAIVNLDDRVSTNETSITNLGNTINELASGTAGLVQQSAPGANLTVGAGTDGAAVDFTNAAGGERRLTGIASGELSAGSSDAVTGAQLNTTNLDVAKNAGDIANLDSRVGANETQITHIDQSVQNIVAGKAGLVQQAGPGQKLTVGAATDGTSVDLTNNAGATRTITGVTAADLSVSSTEAVSGSQLYDTNLNVANNAAGIDKNSQAIAGLDGRVGTNETSITNLGNTINELSSGTLGLVQQSTPGANLTVGAGTDGAAVDFTNKAGSERVLTGIASGSVSAGSSDAVTGSQLYDTNQLVAGNTSSITNLGNTINELISGTAGLVQQSGPGANLTVGAGTDGAAVDFINKAGEERKLTGIASGDLSAGSTDAVTGSQLNATNLDVAKNVDDIVALDGRVGATETQITNIDQSVQNITTGKLGLVQQSGPGAGLTVGAATDGVSVDFTNKDGVTRTLTGIATGNLMADSSDAVNGSQLFATNENVATNAAGIDRNSQAITGLDGRVSTNETSITNLGNTINELSSGTLGLVQQSAPGANLTVGAGTDGAAVDFTNKDGGERLLTGIASGNISAGSTDAVTGGQLYVTNQDVAKNVSAIGALDGRVTTNRTDIDNLSSALNGFQTGSAGIVQQASPTAVITVGKSSGGNLVDLTGTDGPRRLTGVANGIDDHDAVTMAQLKAYDNTMAGTLSSMVSYDSASYTSITLKGQDGTTISNLAAGKVAEGSMDAINGGQLFVLQQQFGDLSKKYAMWQNQGTGSSTPISWAGTGAGSTAVGTGAQASGTNTAAVGQNSAATGESSTAIGQGSIASGQGSTALGQGAGATGTNSVALGAGSVALRDNSVSVGGPGSERQITNVAAGTAPTDAVNVQQMKSYSDKVRSDAYSGVATAMAVAGLPQSTQQGRTLVAVGSGVYASHSGFALGVSYMSRDSRWVVKAAASSSDNGQFGAAAAVGYYF